MLYIPWHFPLHENPNIKGVSLEAEKEFEKQYPAVYQHLLGYKKQLSSRNKAETGIRYEWYALQRWGADYKDDFLKEKIIFKAIGRNLTFCILEGGYFLTAPASFLTSRYDNKYFLGLLLSDLVKYYIFLYSDKTGAGDIMLNIQSFEKIPIPKISQEKQQPFINLVDKIIEGKKQNKDTSLLEKEVDKLVYELYNLTQEEISFIEENTKIK